MRRLGMSVVWGVLLAAVLPAMSAEKLDPAARAKVVAPFVEAATVVVGHADLTRAEVGPALDLAAGLVPEIKDDLAEGRKQATEWLGAFRKAGGRDVYVVLTLAGGFPPEPRVVVLVPLRPGADEEGLRKLLPSSSDLWTRQGDLLIFVSPDRDKTPATRQVQAMAPVERPEIKAAFEAAGDTAGQMLVVPPSYFVRVLNETMPQLPNEIGGGSSTVITDGLRWAAVAVTLPPGAELRMVVQSKDAPAAEALRAKLVEWVKLLGQQKEVIQALPRYNELAAFFLPKVEKDRLVLALREQDPAFKDLMKAVEASAAPLREQARRGQSANNLRQVGLAMHNYHDTHRRLPAAVNCDKNGKPLLSWRVHVLPFIDQAQLYRQFHLDEPWDSPHNRALIAQMPSVYRSPKSKLPRKEGRTNYVVPVGPATMFPGKEGLPFSEVKDGLSNTIMVLEVGDQQAPVWTRPDDWPFDPKDPAKGLGGLYADGFWATMGDGAALFLALPQEPKRLAAMFTRAGD